MNKYIKYVCCGAYNPKYSTKAHKSYIQTKKWKQIRKEVLERDGRKCVICGSKSRLEIHHKTYENWKNENLDELVTLCKTCHTTVHGISSGDGNYVEMLYFDRDDFINMRFSNDRIFHSEITEEFKNSCSRGYGRIPKFCVDIMESDYSEDSAFMSGLLAHIYTFVSHGRGLSAKAITRSTKVPLPDILNMIDRLGSRYGLKVSKHINEKQRRTMYYVALSNQTLDNQN